MAQSTTVKSLDECIKVYYKQYDLKQWTVIFNYGTIISVNSDDSKFVGYTGQNYRLLEYKFSKMINRSKEEILQKNKETWEK